MRSFGQRKSDPCARRVHNLDSGRRIRAHHGVASCRLAHCGHEDLASNGKGGAGLPAPTDEADETDGGLEG